jgi:hypothetical protein
MLLSPLDHVIVWYTTDAWMYVVARYHSPLPLQVNVTTEDSDAWAACRPRPVPARRQNMGGDGARPPLSPTPRSVLLKMI